jgi:hypothetical protein
MPMPTIAGVPSAALLAVPPSAARAVGTQPWTVS